MARAVESMNAAAYGAVRGLLAAWEHRAVRVRAKTRERVDVVEERARVVVDGG